MINFVYLFLWHYQIVIILFCFFYLVISRIGPILIYIQFFILNETNRKKEHIFIFISFVHLYSSLYFHNNIFLLISFVYLYSFLYFHNIYIYNLIYLSKKKTTIKNRLNFTSINPVKQSNLTFDLFNSYFLLHLLSPGFIFPFFLFTTFFYFVD